MIDPSKIPQYTGDLFQLQLAHQGLKSDAGAVRTTGSDVHAKFQGLSAYYKAPEAEQLFASTKPVKDRADEFATDLETVSSALSSYATEIRPLVSKLAELKTKATTFVNSVKDDDNWEYDEDKVEEHNGIRDEITTTVAAFWAAERTCHNKITAIFGGTQMVAGDGSEREDQYGFNAEDLKNAKLPWGDPVEEKHHWYEVGHWVKSFVWDGLIVDGVWGTIKGLGTLVGFGGWEAMGQAWKGLAQLATGLVISSIPGASTLFWTLPDDKLPSWLRDSRTAMKETGKALVAWDEWGKNPARAAGAVTFNVLTTVFTGGTGAAASGAGKAGAVAKALSVAGKAGKVIDPMTYVMKGAGAGLSKIGDISKALKGVGNIEIPKLPDNAITLPEGALKLPDGSFHLPEGAAVPEGAVKLPDGNFKLPDDVPALPEGTTKLPTEPGAPAQYLDPHGNVLDGQGNVVHAGQDAPTDIVDKPDTTSGSGTSGADNPHAPSPVKEPALVGAGAHTAENAGQHVRLGNGLDDNLGDLGRVGDDAGRTTPVVHAGGDTPVVHAGGEHLPGGHAGDHLPGGHTGDHLPGGTAHEHGPGPSASHEPPHGGHGGHGDGPGGPGHEGPGGGGHHEQPSTGGQDGGPGGAADEGAVGGHRVGEHPGAGGGTGGPGGSDVVDAGAHDGPAGWQRPPDEMGPLERGGEVEQAVRDQIRGTKVKPGDVEAILDTLAHDPAGREIADTIASGRFKDAPNFSDVVSNLSRPSELPGAREQIRLANRLHEDGIADISFEVKQGGHEIKPGVFTDARTDLDLMARDARGRVHGYQFKDMTGPDSPADASKVVRNVFKKISQLTESHADVQTFVVDTKASLADMETQIGRLQKGYEGKNVQFVIRTPEGEIFIPRDGEFTPEGA
ncbi:hypothetical protein [Streptomyces griseoaurantiacus]|uniref:hypothetical protein n=1 Tax=Streptomyces griseoaurantiacus TaxID=68213 RepID=UPI002ED2CC0D|nr:hypothetical protein OHA67_15435 [Streptomyces jietaisiensis]